jgi:hypothetical protein
MSSHRIPQLADAVPGESVVLQGNLAFALGCARGGIEVADGYPGTPSTAVIRMGLRFWQAAIDFAEHSPVHRIVWNDRSLGAVVHGTTALREILSSLRVRPSTRSLVTASPLPIQLVRRFQEGLRGPMVVLGDDLRFVQEKIASEGHLAEGKPRWSNRSEWMPRDIAERLGATQLPATSHPVAEMPRPPNICAGCTYRAFGLVVTRLRKKKQIHELYVCICIKSLVCLLDAIDTCTCMGAADANRRGVVLADTSLAARSLSVIGDSTECHSRLDATRNGLFHGIPGVRVVLDDLSAGMTGGQPVPTSAANLAGECWYFDRMAALRAEGADARLVDAFDRRAIEPPPPELRAPLPPPAGSDVQAPAAPLPGSIRVAIRRVSGHGNLLLGKVLAELALRCGFGNIVKGETYGMAQLRGAVICTLACGDVRSLMLALRTADALVALESSEVLRPGSLDRLNDGGVVVLDRLRLVPPGMHPSAYPGLDAIRASLAGRPVAEFDALREAMAIGDTSGRSATVIALGVLSTMAPLSSIPVAIWWEAMARVSFRANIPDANSLAFEGGRSGASETRRCTPVPWS